MAVNIGGGGHLGVSQAAGDNHKGRTVCNHQAGACVPQAVDMDPLKAGVRAEPRKPFRQGIGVHGTAGIVGKDQVFWITPPAPQLFGLLLLPLAEQPEKVQGQRGDPERAAAALVLRGVEVGPVFRGVVQGPADGDGLAVKVHTIPANPQQLPPGAGPTGDQR